MGNLVAYLTAPPISTRFHIRLATVRAVHVMWEPTGNLPAGARPTLYGRDGPTTGPFGRQYANANSTFKWRGAVQESRRCGTSASCVGIAPWPRSGRALLYPIASGASRQQQTHALHQKEFSP